MSYDSFSFLFIVFLGSSYIKNCWVTSICSLRAACAGLAQSFSKKKKKERERRKKLKNDTFASIKQHIILHANIMRLLMPPDTSTNIWFWHFLPFFFFLVCLFPPEWIVESQRVALCRSLNTLSTAFCSRLSFHPVIFRDFPLCWKDLFLCSSSDLRYHSKDVMSQTLFLFLYRLLLSNFRDTTMLSLFC